MGSSKKLHSGKGKKAAQAPFITPERKREIFGILLMTFSLLIALSVLTYSSADNVLVRRFSWDALLYPGDIRASNALGLTGALIARLLVSDFLGYSVLLFPIAGMVWGYAWLRHRSPEYLGLVTSIVLSSSLLVAAFFGWIALSLDFDLITWSGAWGAGLAGWMTRLFGQTGSLVILVILLVISMLLLVDRDIQRSMDRIESMVHRFRNWMDERWALRTSRKLEKKKQREQQSRDEKRRTPSEAGATARTESATDSKPGQASASRMNPDQPGRKHDVEVRSDPSVSVTRQSTVSDQSPSIEAEGGAGSEVAMQIHGQIVEERTDTVQRDTSTDSIPYRFMMPELDLLDDDTGAAHQIDYEELEENKQVLLDKLATYNIEITSINAIVGPTVTLYELTPAPGVKISRITALENDLAMALAARGIRMIAPIPGKSAIGVEIPNRHREFVRIRDVIGTTRFSESKMELPLILGKSIEGEIVLKDLTTLPHLLIAGATGSGKSVGLNTFIAGLLYACPPSHLKFVMIDPKKIELASYARIREHYIAMPPEADDAIITDVDQALGTLRSCEKEMEKRYDLLSKAQVRSLKEYNEAIRSGRLPGGDGHEILPYIVVIVDELADLMMTAGKDIEAPIARLAQMARAIGIHLILATQRPSVDVITGLIKANFPSRIAYQVASKIDSRTILDQNGAEGLVGNGDMLYMLGGHVTRLQGPFVAVEEIENLTRFISDQQGEGPYLIPSLERPDTDGGSAPSVNLARDDLFEEAAHIIVRAQQGSVSLLQRKLSVGYARAARLIDQLEEAGIVGGFEGSKARDVLLDSELKLDQLLGHVSD